MTQTRVLVVEDAPEYRNLIEGVLTRAGFDVVTAPSIAAAEERLAESDHAVVVLDLGLPDGDGLDLCRRIRERSGSYVLVVSGRGDLSGHALDRSSDRLSGFRMGADDFLLKPFSGRELVARVEALLRRPRVEVVEREARVFGDLELDPVTRIVRISGEVIDLTRIEFDLLLTFTADPGAVFTRQRLLDLVWGPGWFGDDHVVDVHVANLRKKVDTGVGPSRVRTVRGVGYGWTV